MSTVQILEKQDIGGTKYPLKKVSFEKPDLDGRLRDEQVEVYFRPDAVGVLLIDEKAREILLTRQFRMPAFLNGSESGYLIEVCAGLIAPDETPEQTARREAMEETGYQLDRLTKVFGVYSSAGGITEFLHLYVANISDAAEKHSRGGLKSENEAIAIIRINFDEAREKLNSGAFTDAKTVLLLQHYFLS